MEIMPKSPIGKGWNLRHTYTSLPEKFFANQKPQSVADPGMVLLNEPLADSLGLDFEDSDEKQLARLFAGNSLPPDSMAIAQAYAGHQFGNFTMLGDGRAVLLGEQEAPDETLWDLQLKGSGRTPFSRRGDGRATLKSMLREFLISEAMHGLGIPSTRSLAVVSTGEPVYRERVQAGAVLTRVAKSHIRVGTFEYAAQYLGTENLKALMDYTIKRHYPHVAGDAFPALAFFKEVVNQQAALIAQWMRVGFIHGVMNTDNMSIAGETIDYGPCAFVNAYHSETVFSSIDTQGRYAFGNQPKVALWNLSCLASSLLPLIHENKETAITLAKEAVYSFTDRYQERYEQMMGEKLGLGAKRETDRELISDLLDVLSELKLDYTHAFLFLQGDFESEEQSGFLHPKFQDWWMRWTKRVVTDGRSLEQVQQLMRPYNPQVIPRNHLVEEVLDQAVNGDIRPLYRLLEVVQNPYNLDRSLRPYQSVPAAEWEMGYQTFCGT
ncbi:protein adenylyltransferase SelO [Lunatimonas salinarum]|uniref:protein adenylyltransferase SelO n=1 Tax=Lunatimonas salinarum TaxID=1774590 RepID=UPI001FD7A8FA|nr:YdiU family protein [Lunatimonas salinarum]